MTHRPFRKPRDGQAGIHSQVGSNHTAIADIHILVVKNSVLRINHSLRTALSDD